MRASPSLSQLWQPHSRLCQLCRVCEQQRSCSPGFCRKEMHATEGAVEVRRARRRLEDTVTDERVGVFTPDKDSRTRRADIGEARDRLWRSGSRPPISSTHGPAPPHGAPAPLVSASTTHQELAHLAAFPVSGEAQFRAVNVNRVVPATEWVVAARMGGLPDV